MKKSLNSINPIFALLLLVVFSVVVTNTFAAISPNDAGRPVVPRGSTVLTSGPLTSISSTFGNRPLPSAPGITTSFGTQTPRLFRSGTPSTCVAPTSPSTFSSGNFAYEAYTFVAKQTECTTIDVYNFPTTALFVGVYSDSFDPANIALNCLADQGSSSPQIFSFNAIAGETYIIVVAEVGNGTGGGAAYGFTVDNVGGSTVPVSIWWIVVAFVAISGFTVYRFRLRRA